MISLQISFEASKTSYGFSSSVADPRLTYRKFFPAIKDTSGTLQAGDSRRSHPSCIASVSDAELEKFVAGRFGWSCEPGHARARSNRSVDPSGIPERGLKEVILYRGEHVVARGATTSSKTGATRTPTTSARRRDDAGQRLQSSSCFGPLNSSWEMKPFLSLSSCWKISSTSLS